jgi:hypothetical protein
MERREQDDKNFLTLKRKNLPFLPSLPFSLLLFVSEQC